ncbi:MAG: UDP-N-acetylmuramate dehydrogenase [Candidatus Pacebacteria bacterium]|nr:UDP-N-acetylmuramate dehydrogenase [Candidatus Paceibacterota bacterium]
MDINKFLPAVKKNVLLKNHTAFKIGGPARYFFEAKNKNDLLLALKTAKRFNLPFFILGGGSNLLVSDKGYKGLVIKILNNKYKILDGKISTETGAALSRLVNASANLGLSGLEWASGIPGTVGGAVLGNAGSFGKSMKDTVKKVEVIDLKTLKFKTYNLKDCKFSYRESVFKRKKNLIIASVILKLKKGKKLEIKKKMAECIAFKKQSQPLNYPSAGSVFKNPSRKYVARQGEEDESSSSTIAAAWQGEEDESSSSTIAAAWQGEEDESSSSTIAAARLIEDCGLKGKTIGRAKISEKHANFIVNLGGASAGNVKKLINLAKKSVKKKFSVSLREEIQLLGF